MVGAHREQAWRLREIGLPSVIRELGGRLESL